MSEDVMPDDEKRARAYKAFTAAREEYLRAAGWTQVAVKMPVDSFEMGPGTREVMMWAKTHDVRKAHLHTLYSTKLALEQQEDFDGYSWS